MCRLCRWQIFILFLFGPTEASILCFWHWLQAAALQEEVQRRQSVHSDGVESITRLQVGHGRMGRGERADGGAWTVMQLCPPLFVAAAACMPASSTA